MGIARKYRLSSGRLFKETYNKGKMLKSPLFVVYYLKLEIDIPQVGIVVSKKFGKAVKRNKIKRRIREIVRQHLPHLKGVVVILPRMKLKNVSFREMKENLDSILRGLYEVSDDLYGESN